MNYAKASTTAAGRALFFRSGRLKILPSSLLFYSDSLHVSTQRLVRSTTVVLLGMILHAARALPRRRPALPLLIVLGTHRLTPSYNTHRHLANKTFRRFIDLTDESFTS